jgi:polyphenol oxidase
MHIFTSTIADGNMSYKCGERDVAGGNRAAFFAAHGIDPAHVVVMSCEHADKIVRVGGETFSGATEVVCEALITNEKNLALFLLTADCYPVVFYDPVHECIGLAHLGWKPTALHLAQKVVARMGAEFGTRAEDIEVYFGPGISAESYVTPTPAQLNNPEWANFMRPHATLPNMYHVDLLGFNTASLEFAGVLSGKIYISGIDTATNSDYFSHYRAAKNGEIEGRFATVVVM